MVGRLLSLAILFCLLFLSWRGRGYGQHPNYFLRTFAHSRPQSPKRNVEAGADLIESSSAGKDEADEAFQEEVYQSQF